MADSARIQALDAYLTPAQPATSPKSGSQRGELVRFIIGIPLLGGAVFYCFSSGRPIFGVILLLCLAFVVLVVVLTLKDNGTSDSAQEPQDSAINRLRADGTLDAVADDFPTKSQTPGDHIRFGDHNAFDHDKGAVYPYARMQRINVQEITDKGATVALTLTAQMTEGGSVTLLVTGGTTEDRALVDATCQRIRQDNPNV